MRPIFIHPTPNTSHIAMEDTVNYCGLEVNKLDIQMVGIYRAYQIALDAQKANDERLRRAAREAEDSMPLEECMRRRWTVQDFWNHQKKNHSWFLTYRNEPTYWAQLVAAETATEAFRRAIYVNETGADSQKCKSAYNDYEDARDKQLRCLFRHYKCCQANEKASNAPAALG